MNRTGDLEPFVVGARNGNGGWGYRGAGISRLEPTVWALLGLRGSLARGDLSFWPSRDGFLLERADGSVNCAFHALGLMACTSLGIEHRIRNAVLAQSILQIKGRTAARSSISRQDNSLQGWPWMFDTFSWVEPTAWCLLALKKRRRLEAIAEDRINVGERLLVDRCCAEGGWNYGNSNMLGQQLKPFVPTTAIALLALQDRRSLPEVRRSLEYLEAHATQERSGSALALASMALQIYGLDNSAVLKALDAQIPTTISLGSHVAAAMALCAMDKEWTEHVFRL